MADPYVRHGQNLSRSRHWHGTVIQGKVPELAVGMVHEVLVQWAVVQVHLHHAPGRAVGQETQRPSVHAVLQGVVH